MSPPRMPPCGLINLIIAIFPLVTRLSGWLINIMNIISITYNMCFLMWVIEMHSQSCRMILFVNVFLNSILNHCFSSILNNDQQLHSISLLFITLKVFTLFTVIVIRVLCWLEVRTELGTFTFNWVNTTPIIATNINSHLEA